VAVASQPGPSPSGRRSSCPRCGFRGYAREIATLDGDWVRPSARTAIKELHPGIATEVAWWSVSEYAYRGTRLKSSPSRDCPGLS
jgi:hypothetical protein